MREVSEGVGEVKPPEVACEAAGSRVPRRHPVSLRATWGHEAEKGPALPSQSPRIGEAASWHREYGSLVTFVLLGPASLPRARMSSRKPRVLQAPRCLLGGGGKCGWAQACCSPVKGEEKPPANPRAGLLCSQQGHASGCDHTWEHRRPGSLLSEAGIRVSGAEQTLGPPQDGQWGGPCLEILYSSSTEVRRQPALHT